MNQLTFYPMHMHLHASHEPTASIGSHMSYASSLGIKHLWLTEHDYRMGQKHATVPKYNFRFTEEILYSTTLRAGFAEDAQNTGSYCFEKEKDQIVLRLVSAMGERESVFYYSGAKRHCDAMFSRLAIELDADMVCPDAQSSVMVEFVLSAQPPTYKQARLRYYIGCAPKEEEVLPVQYLPMPEKKNGKYIFPITRDVGEEIGGLDNAFCNFRLYVENGGEIVFRSFEVDRQLNFEQVRQEQMKVAEKLSKKWGVTPFVCNEITAAGHHKNCYGTHVPVINYIEHNFKVSNEQAIAHVQKHNGIFSWNHPFTETQGGKLTNEERWDVVKSVSQNLINNQVYGATLIEVGFPAGRDGFYLPHYLHLWDELGKAGIFVTGDGDSDNHNAVEQGWIKGNNFCTYAGLLQKEEPTEQNFVKAFKRGSVWFGNPVVMRNLHFAAKNTAMGGVTVGGRVLVSFASTGIQCDGYAKCIVNGEEVKRIAIKDGCVKGRFWLKNTQKYNFARVEIYSADDVGIGFTNPIYLVKDRSDIPQKAIENGRAQKG